MAWRPTEYLIEGELDNTEPGKVTGWLQFTGMDERVTLELRGNFHRDIRGAKVRLRGAVQACESEGAAYMEGFAAHQSGEVGDMTAGLPPYDFTRGQPYFEWFGNDNGRVVLEPDADDVEVIGRPIPACESDPISREHQNRLMANFLAEISADAGVPAIAAGQRLVSDPDFTHWIVTEGHVIGEAREVKPDRNGTCFAYVRLFDMPECAEYGTVERKYLREKEAGLAGESQA